MPTVVLLEHIHAGSNRLHWAIELRDPSERYDHNFIKRTCGHNTKCRDYSRIYRCSIQSVTSLANSHTRLDDFPTPVLTPVRHLTRRHSMTAPAPPHRAALLYLPLHYVPVPPRHTPTIYPSPEALHILAALHSTVHPISGPTPGHSGVSAVRQILTETISTIIPGPPCATFISRISSSSNSIHGSMNMHKPDICGSTCRWLRSAQDR